MGTAISAMGDIQQHGVRRLSTGECPGICNNSNNLGVIEGWALTKWECDNVNGGRRNAYVNLSPLGLAWHCGNDYVTMSTRSGEICYGNRQGSRRCR